MATPYTRLGVPENATPEQIQKARRLLARQHHPDRHGGSPEKEALFKQINADADELLDELRRADLDARLAADRANAFAREAAARAAAAAPKPATAAAPDAEKHPRDPFKAVWAARPFETLAADATAGRPATDVLSTFARGAGMVADLAWKVRLASELHAPARRPAQSVLRTKGAATRCKAIKNDGESCRNSPLPGNYGFCGVHR